MKRNVFILSLLLSLFSLQSKATIIYVDSAHVGGTQTGTSWATAFSNFQSGVNAANLGDSVWVAKGIYQPAVNTSFSMKEGVKVFGGFLNNSTSFSQRNWESNVTILCGNKSTVIKNDSNNLTIISCLDGFTVTKGKITNGVGTGPIGGAGIYNHYASPTIINCTFSSDSSNFLTRGGGMLNYFASPVVMNCIFRNNKTSNGGGAICNMVGTPVISGCKFIDNYADGGGSFYGAGICNIEADPVITDCIFSENKSTGSGGGIQNIVSSSPAISGCSFMNNKASQGGGIYNEDNSNADISNCKFIENVVTSGGGGISNYGSNPNITYCSFTRNDASSVNGGGGAIVGGGIIAYDTFTENIGLDGGAIFVNSSAKIKYCTFNGNKAKNKGGSIMALVYTDTIYNCVFTKDTAKVGGSICNLGGAPYYVNCVITKSIADSIGAGFYNQFSSPSIINTTVSNTAAVQGGNAMYNANNANTAIANCIFWGGNSDILNFGAFAQVSIRNSLVQGLPADIANHNLDGATDPLFVDTALNNYRLLPTSPCINMGNNDSIPASIITDLEGNNRIWDNTVDLGAYEYTFAVNLGNDTAICSGSSVTLDAQNQGSSYLWSTGATTQSIVVNTTGDYNVTITNSWGTITDTVHVAVNPSPTVALGNDTVIAAGASITLNAGNSGASYLWNTGATTQAITVNTSGTYSVTVTNNNECSATDTIKVTLDPLGIDDVNESANNIVIRPNPAKEVIHIDISDLKLLGSKAVLTDAYGRMIRMVLIENKSQPLSLAGLASGIYILKTENGATAKIVKE